MARKVLWGVLGTSDFALSKVIPAMRRCEFAEVAGLASRSIDKALEAAAAHGIPAAYGSYEDLLEDPAIEVVYNPLPNHLHVPWSIRALDAGKHVLCEKPLGLNAGEARDLLAARDRSGRLAGEAFMIQSHPQFVRAREIVSGGEIGELRALAGWFSYFNPDPSNIRNVAACGGGGLLDIGCYPIFVSRMLFAAEPTRVSAAIEKDPGFGIDRLTSAILEFPGGHATFTCSTQLTPAQRVIAFGTKARLEIEVPYNAPPDRPCRIWVDDGSDLHGASAREEVFPVCDQYTIEADLFSRAVLGECPVPVPIEESVKNMAVIDAIFRAAASGRWEPVGE